MSSPSRKWIFLRGLGRHSLHWGPFVESFKNTFPQDEIELLDLRGNGRLSHSPSCLTIADNVRDLRSRSKILQKGDKVFLMTISLGSMIAADWATKYPDEIAGFVAVNTSDRGNSSFFERLRPANYLRLLMMLPKLNKSLEIEKQILNLTTNSFADKDKWAESFLKLPATSRLNFARQLVAAGTFEFPIHKPRTEVLLLCSEGDRLVHPQCTKRIAEMWVLKAQTHPHAGHDLPTEDPAWVCGQIENWLKALPLTQISAGRS